MKIGVDEHTFGVIGVLFFKSFLEVTWVECRSLCVSLQDTKMEHIFFMSTLEHHKI